MSTRLSLFQRLLCFAVIAECLYVWYFRLTDTPEKQMQRDIDAMTARHEADREYAESVRQREKRERYNNLYHAADRMKR